MARDLARRNDSVDIADFFCRLLDRAAWIAAAAVIGAVLMGIVRGALTEIPYFSTVRMQLVSESDEGFSAAIVQAEHLVQDYVELFRTEELHRLAAEAALTGHSADQLMEMVSVEIPEGTHILCMTVRAPEAGDAERIATAYADSFSHLAKERLNVPAPGIYEAPTKAKRADIPVTAQNCVFGGLAGIAAACALIALTGMTDDRIRTPEGAEEAVGAKLLGILSLQKARSGSDPFPLDAAGKKQAAYLADNLLSSADGRRTFAVASCHDGDGKSFTAVQLARAFAQDGRKTVLVSAGRGGYPAADDRKNTLSLTDWQASRCSASGLARETAVQGLRVIDRESLLRSGKAKILGEDLRALLSALESEGFFVVVDAPSSSRSVEASRIAGACGGFVMVALYGSTRCGELTEAAQMLRQSGGCALGCVLNGVRLSGFEAKRKFPFWYSVSKRAKKKDSGKVCRKR